MGNAALFDRIAETGLLVSEWIPGAEPLRPRFLIRNRVIAAATSGTVLVEAAARSGATQTLNRALGLRRPAMVVPGPVTSAMSVGGHEVLRERPEARLVTNVAHVLEEVGRIGYDLAPPARAPERARDRLDEEATQVLEALPRRRALDLESVAARAGVDLRTAMRKLSMLEELGMVVRRDGGYALAPSSPEARTRARQSPSNRISASRRSAHRRTSRASRWTWSTSADAPATSARHRSSASSCDIRSAPTVSSPSGSTRSSSGVRPPPRTRLSRSSSTSCGSATTSIETYTGRRRLSPADTCR
jgi:DNA processing protein